jgi:N-acyl-D-amino-acid deacylase
MKRAILLFDITGSPWFKADVAVSRGRIEIGKLGLAKAKNADQYDFAFDLLIDDETSTAVIRFALSEKDVCTVLKSELTAVGSDGYSLAPYGPLGRGKPHPRSYGTFARVLGKYVREEGVLRLEEAVKKMTSLPARKLGLWNRGMIRPKAWADIAIFKLEDISDTATFANPHQYAKGMLYVIVNGVLTVEQGEHTGAEAGTVLRRR